MGQISVLCDALGDVNLGLEAIDACVGRIGLSHNTADATSDHLCYEKLLISDLNTTVLIAASDCDIVLVGCSV